MSAFSRIANLFIYFQIAYKTNPEILFPARCAFIPFVSELQNSDYFALSIYLFLTFFGYWIFTIANSQSREILRGEFSGIIEKYFRGYRFIAEQSIYNSRRISANFHWNRINYPDPVTATRVFVRRMTFRHASVFVPLKADIVSVEAAVYCFIWLG